VDEQKLLGTKIEKRIKMKKDASKDFKAAVDKAFTTQPNVKLNSSTMKDAMNLKQQFKEQEELVGGVGDKMSLKQIAKKHGVSLWELVSQFDLGVEVEREHTNDLKKAMEIAVDHLTEDPKYYQKLNKIEKNVEPKVTAKKQFAQDLQLDKDFIDFKKRAKYKEGYKDFNFGTPNVSHDDPYIKKRKWSRPGKEETFENIDKDLKGNDKEMVNGIKDLRHTRWVFMGLKKQKQKKLRVQVLWVVTNHHQCGLNLQKRKIGDQAEKHKFLVGLLLK